MFIVFTKFATTIEFSSSEEILFLVFLLKQQKWVHEGVEEEEELDETAILHLLHNIFDVSWGLFKVILESPLLFLTSKCLREII